jgi:hypothetical protein
MTEDVKNWLLHSIGLVIEGNVLDDRGSIPGTGWDVFLLATASRPALGPKQSLI